jgi:hypothetical protein
MKVADLYFGNPVEKDNIKVPYNSSVADNKNNRIQQSILDLIVEIPNLESGKNVIELLLKLLVANTKYQQNKVKLEMSGFCMGLGATDRKVLTRSEHLTKLLEYLKIEITPLPEPEPKPQKNWTKIGVIVSMINEFIKLCLKLLQ